MKRDEAGGPGGEPIEVLHRDDHLVVINKPSGLLVHRGWAQDPVVAMTLVRDLLGRHVHPVHRLDRGASGALVFALDPATARGLGQIFMAGGADKRYLALVRGVPPLQGCIDHPIPQGEDGPRVPAQTGYRLLRVFGIDSAQRSAAPFIDGRRSTALRAINEPGRRYALVEAHPTSGRLHQIRRHLKHLGHPLIGDVNYGKGEHNRLFRERYGLRRLALHAAVLSFLHPMTGVPLRIEAPLTDDLRETFARMGWGSLDIPALLGAMQG